MPDGRHRSALPRHWVARCIRAALLRPAEIAVRLVGEAEGLRLNRAFRRQAHATNVLTFAYTQEPVITADLVLCAPVVEREALDLGRELRAHYAHLLVHGTLHAQGMDHIRPAPARRMEAEETKILAGLGVPDPYALR